MPEIEATLRELVWFLREWEEVWDDDVDDYRLHRGRTALRDAETLLAAQELRSQTP
jgi:hypothetical protein